MLSSACPNQATPHSDGLLIHVRPDDTLLWSFPLWLICHRFGIPVRQAAPARPALSTAAPPHTVPTAPALRTPEVRLRELTLAQPLTIIETLHELYPHAGVWPNAARARARARDACAGLLTLYGPGTGGAMRCDRGMNGSKQAHVTQRLRSALDDDRHGTVCAVAAAVAVLDIDTLFVMRIEAEILDILENPAASAWLLEPPVQARQMWGRGFGLSRIHFRAGMTS